MNIVETTAPISIEQLKKYFVDKNTFYSINYRESNLKGSKLLTYISNLDIPCDINFAGCSYEEFYNMLEDYLQSTMIVNVNSLEQAIINILLQTKDIIKKQDIEFIQKNEKILNSWIEKLDSLTLYNMFIVSDPVFNQYVNTFPCDDDTSLSGINFVSILKHTDTYTLYQNIDESKLKYFKSYFNEYMFKGKSLYNFWANENNPLFLLTYGIAEGNILGKNYILALNETLKEIENVTSI
jgi:hypothetical protein